MSTRKNRGWKKGKIPYRRRLYLPSVVVAIIGERAEKENREDIYLISKAVEEYFLNGGHHAKAS